MVMICLKCKVVFTKKKTCSKIYCPICKGETMTQKGYELIREKSIVKILPKQ